MVDDKRYFDVANLSNRKYSQALLPQDQIVYVRCCVLPDTIVVTCGDKEVIRWHGDPRRLSVVKDVIPPNYSESDRTHLWLGSWESGFVLRQLELKPLSDAEADELSNSFSGVFPTTPQADVPFATVSARTDTKDTAPAIGPEIPTNPSSSPPVRQPSQPGKAGEWIDLLEWSEGVEWEPRGINWNAHIEGKATRNGIRMKNAKEVRFPLPAIPMGTAASWKRNSRGPRGISRGCPLLPGGDLMCCVWLLSDESGARQITTRLC